MSTLSVPKEYIVAHPSSIRTIIRTLDSRRVSGNSDLKYSGKSTVALDSIPASAEYVNTKEEAMAYSKWVIQSYKHAQYVLDNVGLLSQCFTGDGSKVSITDSGLTSKWSIHDLNWLSVHIDALSHFNNMLVPIPAEENSQYGMSSNRFLWAFSETKMYDTYLGDSTQPLLPRAVWLDRRDTLMSNLGYGSGEVVVSRGSINGVLLLALSSWDSERIASDNMARIVASLNNYSKHRVSSSALSLRRAEVLRLQKHTQSSDDSIRRQLANKNFVSYWQSMKDRQRSVAPTLSEAKDAWKTIPLHSAGVETSRTWGIEVETVRADETSTPRGWRDVNDQSLHPDSGGGSCDCGCDSCYDDEHCNRSHRDCYYDEGHTAREYVSPKLKHFNSSGLRNLCSDLGDDEENTTPGIHLHVGAGDLTVTDIARLLFAYAVASPLIENLYYRQDREYCSEMFHDNVQHWLSAVKRSLRETGAVPTVREVLDTQPANRYVDVNLHALSKHGTVEFRAMGPHYNYEHLVRWAWFCREMVNVSRLNIPQPVWTSCTSVEDVIKVLRTYGSESPLDKANESIIVSELVLTEG